MDTDVCVVFSILLYMFMVCVLPPLPESRFNEEAGKFVLCHTTGLLRRGAPRLGGVGTGRGCHKQTGIPHRGWRFGGGDLPNVQRSPSLGLRRPLLKPTIEASGPCNEVTRPHDDETTRKRDKVSAAPVLDPETVVDRSPKPET